MVYGNYAYPHGKYAHNSLRRSNLSARGSYNSSNNFSNYKLRVMPYDEDLREDFLENIQPSNVAIYVLVGIVVIMYLFAVYLATKS
jgi:hypothetical protein